MGKYEDEDGIDGPWERAMRRAMGKNHQNEREPENHDEKLFVENATDSLIRAVKDLIPYASDRKKAVLRWLLDEYDPQPPTPQVKEDPDISF